MRDKPEIIIIIMMVLLVVALIFGFHRCSVEYDNKLWNDGHCTCGGNWEYEQAVGHQYSTSYIYDCENCGKRIEIHEVR